MVKDHTLFTIAAALARILESRSLDGMLDSRVRGDVWAQSLQGIHCGFLFRDLDHI